MLLLKQNRFLYINIAIFIFLFDQLSKYVINLNHTFLVNKNFIIFNIVFVKNYGAAFNLLSGSRIFLSIVSLSFAIILLYLILKKKSLNLIELYSYSFILGGTLGNGIDRIIKGYVLDFIEINYINFPAFNIADISINIGFLLVLYSLVKFKK